MKRAASVLMLALSFTATLSAQDKGAASSHDISVAFRFGTLGFGLEAGKLLTNHVSARLGANYFSFSTSKTQSDLSYDASLKMAAVSMLADLYPKARGSFHFTVGLMTDPLKINGTGVPSGSGTYTINSVDYTAAQVGTLTVQGKWPGVSPYLGLGFGTPATKHHALTFIFDLGMAIGQPTLSLAATGALNSSQLASDLEAQRVKTQNDVRKYAKVYPVIDFGLGYKF